ncbi:MAG: hypothetical protein ACFFD3_13695 [Candidatus Thorarchaeota archaeon]
MGLADAIRNYFSDHPRAKKALGIASAIATNFAMIASGSALLAVAAGTIVKHQDDKEKVRPGELLDFFKEAIQDPEVRNSLKNTVTEGDIGVASNVSMALNQLGASRPQTAQFVDTMKSEITVVLQQIGIIREMVSYYEIPDSFDRVKNVWRLPTYIDDVLVIDQNLRGVLDLAIREIQDGKNIAILGAPGSGKTTALYAIWKELDEESNLALVWDTKDVSRVHERDGVILFNDDIPETRELVKAITERDTHGIVTTAREQEWSRLPVELRKKFTTIDLPMPSEEAMSQIAARHLESQSIKFDKKNLDLLVANARGSPIYIRYMVEEIGTEAKAGGPSKLTESRIRTAPKGMSDYVAGILARILFELDGTIYKPKAGALPVIKTLLCLADMPNYETHEVHLNQLFFKIKTPTDAPGPFNAVKQYLARDPRFFSLKFMHDTLADVLRGKVDHPIVGDIRMLAQEMGVAGRLRIEKQALIDGWEHVKEEYGIDSSGGLEPLLAYGYFTAKNFGPEYLDRLVIELANSHMDNPLSQAFIAITGPNIEKLLETSSYSEDQTTETQIPEPIRDRPAKPVSAMQNAPLLSESDMNDIKSGIKELERVKEVVPGLGEAISKIVESKISGITASEISGADTFGALEQALKQESVNPRRLSRLLQKAALKISIHNDRGKLVEAKKKGEIITQAAERLVLLDSMEYIEILEELSDSLSITLGRPLAAETITRILGEIDVSQLDAKTKDSILKVYDRSAKKSEQIGNYEGMKKFLRSKWALFGVDTKDLDLLSNRLGKLMKLGRTVFALENATEYVNEFELIEYKVGVTLQTFNNLANANIGDREEYQQTIQISGGLFHSVVKSLDSSQLLTQNESAAELCTSLLSSVVSITDRFVKKSGKSVALEAFYPLLHEAMKPLFISVFDILVKIGLKKQLNVAYTITRKINGESDHKTKILEASESLKQS